MSLQAAQVPMPTMHPMPTMAPTPQMPMPTMYPMTTIAPTPPILSGGTSPAREDSFPELLNMLMSTSNGKSPRIYESLNEPPTEPKPADESGSGVLLSAIARDVLNRRSRSNSMLDGLWVSPRDKVMASPFEPMAERSWSISAMFISPR